MDLEDERKEFIKFRESQLYQTVITASETAVKYLFITNSGGAIGVLTYLGALAPSNSNITHLKIALFLFFLGVVLVGIMRAYAVHLYSKIFYKFQESLFAYYKEGFPWEAFIEEVRSQNSTSKISYILGYLSFACFLVGAVIGTVG